MSREIIEFLATGKKTWREVCSHIGESESVVSTQLKTLAEWGLIGHELSDQLYYFYSGGSHESTST